MRRLCYFSVLLFGFPVSSFHCSCVVSLWRALPFIRKFNRRVTQSTPSTAHTSPPASSISEQDSFFSNATLRHASRQILLLLRDILIGFPALLLTVASLVRLPSFIANIASACLSRQVSLPCRPLSTIIHCHAHPLMLGRYLYPNRQLASACSLSAWRPLRISSGRCRTRYRASSAVRL